MLTDKIIRESTSIASSYSRGCKYYRDGSVGPCQYDAAQRRFSAVVFGSKRYKVDVEFTEGGDISAHQCNCPAFSQYTGACKHIVALLKEIQEIWPRYFTEASAGAEPAPSPVRQELSERLMPPVLRLSRPAQTLMNLFQQGGMATHADNRTEVRLIPIYRFSIRSGYKTNCLEFLIGSDKLYVLKDIPRFLQAWENDEALPYGKGFTLKASEQVFSGTSLALLQLLQRAQIDEQYIANWNLYSMSGASVFSDKRYFKLNNTALLAFFELQQEEPFSLSINNENAFESRIVKARPPIAMTIKAIRGGIRMELELNEEFLYALDASCSHLYHKGLIYRVDEEFAKRIKPLLRCCQDSRSAKIDVPDTAASEFISTVLPVLEQIGNVQVDKDVSQRVHKEPLEKRVYFDRWGDGISGRVEFSYGDALCSPAVGLGSLTDQAGKLILRDISEENRLLEELRRYGFVQHEELFVQEDEAAVYHFLQDGVDAIGEQAEVFYTDAFKKIRINDAVRISAGVRINGGDMLEFTLHHEGISPKELFDSIAAYKLKKRYHRLRDGSFLAIDLPEFETAAKLIDGLSLKEADLTKQTIELPKYRALYLDSLARESDDFHMERSGAFRKMIQEVKEPQDAEFKVPVGIQGKLREYQKTGVKWLNSLAAYGLGGILADDMGLGKTLQAITFLLGAKQETALPSLVVAPTSLVFNWQEEVRKFAPELTVAVIAGQPEMRLEQLAAAAAADLVVTSYGMLKRDIDFYAKKEFQYCFLDEAQHIKNPQTLAAKSVKNIRAAGYFALTGTPIENTLTELWSIFDFLMPGYLGSQKSFSKRFEVPIVKNRDADAMKELSRHIKPFILRRMKKTVLKELPDKMESKLVNEMNQEQAKIYAGWLQQAKQELAEEIQTNGFEKSRIKMLSLLTRLRQICCHPALFIENYHGSSGKLDSLNELLEDALDGGHRILLFSQFTGMLELIRQQLTKRGIAYHYLDGATKAEERMRLVNVFNAGAGQVFLISLKAGGTGLNLTGADMVIHYDPWWNPAVEEQATDRAYRMGQKKAVQVYKLITKGTIEEKIYALQEKKKEMVDALIQPGETLLSKLSEAEIRNLFDL